MHIVEHHVGNRLHALWLLFIYDLSLESNAAELNCIVTTAQR